VSFGAEHRLDVAEALVQAMEQVQHLAWLGDRVANVTVIVGELLQLVAIVSDGEIALNEVVEFDLKEHRVLHLVIIEQPLDVWPNGEGGSIWFCR
jgi:hypothetical protein